MTHPGLYVTEFAQEPFALVAKQTDVFGFETVDLAWPPSRFGAAAAPESVGPIAAGIDAARVTRLESPASLLLIGAGMPAAGISKASESARARLMANFLIAEDPQRRLDSRPVETLAHQISLVRHVLDNPNLRRVLIADEVGLGKTIEAGLILQELIAARPALRVLYLAPARLVGNVRREFDQLRLGFRQWSALEADARLSDSRIVASLHRAVHGKNRQLLLDAGPWDVLVVDECHHLSAWGADGGDTTNAFRLVRDLSRKLPPDGRLILMSGTPHQGSPVRFRNLVDLLRCDGEDDEAIRGRVIYRTKEDVRDWNDRPLFPPRVVNQPVIVDLGAAGRSWLSNIHAYFTSRPAAQASESARRASGWRCALALQWAASSPQAGLGYLVRHALRGGLDLDAPGLATAIAAIRPYRNGSTDEPVEALMERLRAETQRQRRDHEIEDIEDDGDECNDGLLLEPGKIDAVGLGSLLVEGAQLLQKTGSSKWDRLWSEVLEPAGTEKVVLFAQPIETVCALARYLEGKTGTKPSIIIGGQRDDERKSAIDRFRAPDGPRFLVSSRAGGEGINLQFARRLVHVDVPWNPMELEQRVGRVHRFGSRLPIIVDTIVTKDSRESDAYRVARRKLEQIAGTLVEPSRMDMIFSRVMSLVPPEELQELMIGSPLAPCSAEDETKIANLVRAGFEDWRSFHASYGKQQNDIRAMPPGAASWSDLQDFCVRHLGAECMPGLASEDFGREGLSKTEVAGVRFQSSGGFVCGDHGGTPILDRDGNLLKKLGVNTPEVLAAIAKLTTDTSVTGIAHFRADQQSNALLGSGPQGVLIWRVQEYQLDGRRGWVERSVRLAGVRISDTGTPQPLQPSELPAFIRWSQQATLRRQCGDVSAIASALKAVEDSYGLNLWRGQPQERTMGIARAVVPILAATLMP
jgi:superfamily II DNA or RNA helicase